MIYIGIDNGVSGALAAIHAEHPQVVRLRSMPIQKARKGNEIDVADAAEWLRAIAVNDTLTVIIEEPGGSQSAKAASSMAGSFHALRAICEIRGYRWHRITPQSWQKVMLPGCKAAETKKRALSKAKQLWPSETWLESPRCRVPHDGWIDAALIAEYGRLANL